MTSRAHLARFPGLVQEFTGRLRESTERLHSLTMLGGRLLGGGRPAPAARRPVRGAADRGRRQHRRAAAKSIEVLKAQLSSFDEQLKALEQFLGPLAEWSRTWA